jgi:RNA polymerase sigma factor (sigma-70 family)
MASALINASWSRPPYLDVIHDAGVGAQADRGAEDVYREHAARLWRALVAFTGDRDVSSDAVAEAFAQLLARGSAVRDPAAWVWRAAFRIAAGELGTRRDSVAFANREFADVDAATAEGVDLMLALQQLPTKQRAAVVLRYLVELPTARVARILGISPPTVRVHLMKARRRLRTILEVTDD